MTGQPYFETSKPLGLAAIHETEVYDNQLVDFDVYQCLDLETINWYRSHYERNNRSRSYSDKDDIKFLSELGLLRETPHDRKATKAAVLLFGRDGAVRELLPRPIADVQYFKWSKNEAEQDPHWAQRLVLDTNLLRSWRILKLWYWQIFQPDLEMDLLWHDESYHPEINDLDKMFFEAIINILIHQDYANHYRKPQIRLYSDQQVFFNPGAVPILSNDTSLDISENPVRNSRITSAFRRIGLCTDAGNGLRMLAAHSQNQGIAPPVVNNNREENWFKLVLSLPHFPT